LKISVRNYGYDDVNRGNIRFRVMENDNVLVISSEIINDIVEINNRKNNCGNGSFSIRMNDIDK
jgi:hypothetical protein